MTNRNKLRLSKNDKTSPEDFDVEIPQYGWVDYERPTTLRTFIGNSLYHHPFLYGNDEYSRIRVLSQLFLSIGNGLEWRNGLPTETDGEFVAEDSPVPEKIWTKLGWNDEKYFKDLMKFIDSDGIHLSFYPCYEDRTLLTEMPDDVPQDFLEGAIELLNFIIKCPPQFFGYESITVTETQMKEAIRAKLRFKKIRRNIVKRFGIQLPHNWQNIGVEYRIPYEYRDKYSRNIARNCVERSLLPEKEREALNRFEKQLVSKIIKELKKEEKIE